MRMMRLDLNKLQRCTRDKHLRKGEGRRREVRTTEISGEYRYFWFSFYVIC